MSDQGPDTDALSEAQLHVRSILDTAVDGIVTIDERGIVESFNPGAERMFGYPAGEVLGRNVSMLMFPSEADQHDGFISRYLDTGQRQIIGIGREVVARRKDGSAIPIRLSVSEWIHEGRRRFTGMTHDLSEARAAERREAELARILEESLNEVYVFDAETLRFLHVNQCGRDNLGYSMQELREMSCPDLTPGMTSEGCKMYLSPLKLGSRGRIEQRAAHRRRDGSTYPVEALVQTSTWEGQPAFVAIVLDVTERQRLEDGMRHAAKMAAMGELSGNIAHEINNPVGIMSAKARLLLTGQEVLSPKVRRDLERIVQQCDRIAGLTRRLLDYARPSIHPKGPIDPRLPLERSLAMVEEKASRGGIELIAELPDRLPAVHGNAQELEQVLLNLFINAIQAMPDGGRLEVSTCAAEGELCLRVVDTGEGMDEETQARIFEPFFTTKGLEGTGLGLAIGQSLIADHGGRLQVESTLGEGTTFQINLPIALHTGGDR
jgi:PAS domain S-box-containing protein